MWYRVAALMLASAIAIAGSADRAAAQGSTKDVRTFVTLHVNTIDQGETVAILRGDDVLIPVSVLDQAGVKGLKGKREDDRGTEYVSLASLAPDVTFKFDVDALSLDITVGASHFGKTSVSLYNNRPKNIEYTGGSSAYLNYALLGAPGSSSAFFDGGVNHDQDALHYAFTLQTNSALQRGLVYYQMDNRDTELQRVAGDVDANSGDLGGSTYVAGFGVARDFTLDPYAIHFPLPSLQGVATSPSVANIYVNGVLVQRIELPPGDFNLNQLPLASGSANAQIVVTDAFGRSQAYSENYYSAPTILSPGTTDFQYTAGLLEQNVFQTGGSYGPLAAVGRYRGGVSDTLTLGGRFEATPALVSLGPSADFATHLGAFHLALAASDDDAFGGAAASFGYTYAAQRFGLGVSFLAQGPYYANISQAPADDRSTTALTVFINEQIGRSSLGFQWARRHDRDQGATDQLSLTDNLPVFHDANFALTLESDTSENGAPTRGITGTLDFAVGRTNVSATSQAGTTRDDNVTVQYAPESKYGLGFYTLYDPSFNQSVNGAVTYKNQYGNGELDFGDAGSGTPFTEAVRLSSGLAFIGGGVFPTAPILGSYALVDVPDTPGVSVYFENQYVGKTNKSGELLVPDLEPNFGNVLRIDDEDVPLNASIQTVERLIAPPEQAGAVVRFEAQYLHALTGTLVVLAKGKPIVPVYGDLTVSKGTFQAESALGGNGEFYLENVPAGTYTAKVLYAGGECTFDFTSPATSKAFVKMGQLECKV